MAIELIQFEGNVNIGLYSATTDQFSIISDILPSKMKDSISRVLKTEIISLTTDSTIIGALIKANKSGIVLSSIISEKVELEIKNLFPNLVINRFDFDYFALGNLIVTTDKRTLIPPLIPKKSQKLISEVFDTEIITLQLNNSDLLGSLVTTNSLGAVISPLVEKEEEIENLTDLLGLKKIEISTVNRGAHFPSSGIICNKTGALLGQNSTGIETVAISNALFPI